MTLSMRDEKNRRMGILKGREEGERMGLLKGRQEGKQEGRQEGILKLAKKMSAQEIADILELPMDYVEQVLRKSL